MKHLKEFKMFEDVLPEDMAQIEKSEDVVPIDHTADVDDTLDIPSTPESQAKTKLADDLKTYLNAMLKKHGLTSFEECKKGTPECAAFEEDAKKGWIKDVGPTPYGKEIMAEFGA